MVGDFHEGGKGLQPADVNLGAFAHGEGRGASVAEARVRHDGGWRSKGARGCGAGGWRRGASRSAEWGRGCGRERVQGRGRGVSARRIAHVHVCHGGAEPVLSKLALRGSSGGKRRKS